MLSRKNRVRTSSFRNPTGLGRSFFIDEMSLKVTKNGLVEPPQCAVIVSKKVAKTAVERNTLRRKIYSTLIPIVSTLPPGYRFFFYPKQEIMAMSGESLNKAVLALIGKTGLR